MLKHSLRIFALAGLVAGLAGGGLVFPEAALAQIRDPDPVNPRPLPPPLDTGEVKGLVEYIVEDATPIGDILCDIRDLCGFIWEWGTTPFLEGVTRMAAELEGTPVPVPTANPGPVAPVTPVPVPAATPTPSADGETGGDNGAPRPVWGPTPDPVWGPPGGDPGRPGVYITLDGEVLDLYEILELGDPDGESDEAAEAGEGDGTDDQSQRPTLRADYVAIMPVIPNIATNPAVFVRPPVQHHPQW